VAPAKRERKSRVMPSSVFQYPAMQDFFVDLIPRTTEMGHIGLGVLNLHMVRWCAALDANNRAWLEANNGSLKDEVGRR